MKNKCDRDNYINTETQQRQHAIDTQEYTESSKIQKHDSFSRRLKDCQKNIKIK